MTLLPFPLTTPNGIAIFASAVFALTSLVAMVILYGRRLYAEHRQANSLDEDRQLARELLKAISTGAVPEDAPIMRIRDRERFVRVFSHVMQLVRGAERERLLAIADQIELLKKARRQLRSPSWTRRINAIWTLEQFPTPTSVEAIRYRMLVDTQCKVRTQAAAVLSRMNRPPAPQTLIDVLELRTAPITALHAAILRTAAPQFTPQMSDLSQDPAMEAIRPILVDALGWSRRASVIPLLEQHARDPNPEVRAAALRAVRNLGGSIAAERWIVAMLNDPVDFVQTQAARTCAKLQYESALPLLEEMLHHPSWWVRKRVRDALHALGTEQHDLRMSPGLAV